MLPALGGLLAGTLAVCREEWVGDGAREGIRAA